MGKLPKKLKVGAVTWNIEVVENLYLHHNNVGLTVPGDQRILLDKDATSRSYCWQGVSVLFHEIVHVLDGRSGDDSEIGEKEAVGWALSLTSVARSHGWSFESPKMGKFRKVEHDYQITPAGPIPTVLRVCDVAYRWEVKRKVGELDIALNSALGVIQFSEKPFGNLQSRLERYVTAICIIVGTAFECSRAFSVRAGLDLTALIVDNKWSIGRPLNWNLALPKKGK